MERVMNEEKFEKEEERTKGDAEENQARFYIKKNIFFFVNLIYSEIQHFQTILSRFKGMHFTCI